MLPQRPCHTISYPSCRPSFGLFPGHRGYSQRENGTTPDARERFLVSGPGTPNLRQVAFVSMKSPTNRRIFPSSMSNTSQQDQLQEAAILFGGVGPFESTPSRRSAPAMEDRGALSSQNPELSERDSPLEARINASGGRRTPPTS
jgi:hypothetical protein